MTKLKKNIKLGLIIFLTVVVFGLCLFNIDLVKQTKSKDMQIGFLESEIQGTRELFQLNTEYSSLPVSKILNCIDNELCTEIGNLTLIGGVALMYLSNLHCSDCVKEESRYFINYLISENKNAYFVVPKSDYNIISFISSTGYSDNIIFCDMENAHPDFNNIFSHPTVIIVGINNLITNICFPTILPDNYKKYFYKKISSKI